MLALNRRVLEVLRGVFLRKQKVHPFCYVTMTLPGAEATQKVRPKCWTEDGRKEGGGIRLLLPEHPLPGHFSESTAWVKREQGVRYHPVFLLDP